MWIWIHKTSGDWLLIWYTNTNILNHTLESTHVIRYRYQPINFFYLKCDGEDRVPAGWGAGRAGVEDLHQHGGDGEAQQGEWTTNLVCSASFENCYEKCSASIKDSNCLRKTALTGKYIFNMQGQVKRIQLFLFAKILLYQIRTKNAWWSIHFLKWLHAGFRSRPLLGGSGSGY